MKRYLVGFILAASVAACGAGGGLPSGWRPATRDDVKAQLAHLNLDAASRPPADQAQAAQGDFDGDGRADRALLLVNDKAQKFALFVLRAGAPAARLTEDQPLGELWNTGVRIARPGRYVTACAQGAGASKPCVPSLTARFPAILFETYESSAEIFAWNGKAFDEAWLSD